MRTIRFDPAGGIGNITEGGKKKDEDREGKGGWGIGSWWSGKAGDGVTK